MHEPTILLTEPERMALSRELEKLFALQDKPLGKDKLQIFIEELEKSTLPAAAMIAGIRALSNDDLKTIKLGLILEASRRFIDRTEDAALKCDDCDGRGVVLMRDAKRYQFSLACHCGNAQKWQAHHLAQWNGEESQMIRGRLLVRS